MSNYTLVLLSVSGIQQYVFGSNQLAQNIGASELVWRSTTEWVEAALKELGLASNVDRSDSVEGLVLNAARVDADADAEVVYAGGGNTMLIFAAAESAKEFIQDVTSRAIREARGLQLIATQEPFDWPSDSSSKSLVDAHHRSWARLAQRKLDRTLSRPLLGQSVTATCVYTGLPAVGFDDDKAIVGRDAAAKMRQVQAEARLISCEVAHKLKAEAAGRARLREILKDQLGERFDLIYDFGHFGTPNESSYIAVVHADANKMGDRVKNIGDAAADNRDYITQLRQFSASARRNAHYALRETAEYLLATWNETTKTFGTGGEINVSPWAHLYRGYPLPFRPIVFGGDDVTFVSDGRLGLPLAARYLEAFTADPLADKQAVHARAGVAVVKTHFPFSRAYDVAGELMQEAKDSIEQLKAPGEESATVMDWHFSTTGIVHSLEEIRRREYSAATGNCLLMRPVRIHNGNRDDQWRTWDQFRDLVRAFQKDAWASRRNKVVALRDAVRGGPGTFQLFTQNYRIHKSDVPPVHSKPEMQTRGWQDDRTAYFDPIEAIDFFVALESENGEEGQ